MARRDDDPDFMTLAFSTIMGLLFLVILGGVVWAILESIFKSIFG